MIRMPASKMLTATIAVVILSAGFNVPLTTKFVTMETVLIVIPTRRLAQARPVAIATTTRMPVSKMPTATIAVVIRSAGFNAQRVTKFVMMAMDLIATLTRRLVLAQAQIVRMMPTAPTATYAW